MYFPIVLVHCNPGLRHVVILLSIMIDVHWIHDRKGHRMSPFLDVFVTRNQSRLNGRVRIVTASNVIDVIDEDARKQHVVLQCRIDVFSSRVTLNCSKE